MNYSQLSFKDTLGLSTEELQRSLLKLLLGMHELAQEAGEASREIVPTPISAITPKDHNKALEIWRSDGLPMLPTLPGRPCPACEAETSHAVFESYDGYTFHECQRCGTWYVPLGVTWDLFARLFEKSPAAAAVAKDVASQRRSQLEDQDLSRFLRYLAAVMPLLPEREGSLRYLDIGCNVGHSLQAAKSVGILAHGVEVDPYPGEIARREGHTVVRFLEDLPPGNYDIISFWETLEHIADPLAELQLASSRLAEGGLLVFTVPNLMALGLRLLREKCTYAYGGFNSPGHINFFSKRSIALLLDRAGLSLINVDYEYSNMGVELAGYLQGGIDPAQPFSILSPPKHLSDFVNGIWPIITMIESTMGTLPMMQCIACHKGSEPLFAGKLAEKTQAAAANIREQAIARLKESPDPASLLEAMKEELQKRDDHVAMRIYRRIEKIRTSLQSLFRKPRTS
ncbi:MAG TPA: class I SAM-dependent methyltransferase [Humidesulfovibrio sp.]|uniref:class I SAM-dependent methyltransferase n=1 Tax=Humidesulfovibrio sp. TaxID=2910988 RepID=UPI002C064B1B|nr:class I SAM-dependent methyltransferase [Humidesulfovibrio sp.]HWR02663.1 class I SAM-dependent methyltransferase [Humidesulfovibrio sp.]